LKWVRSESLWWHGTSPRFGVQDLMESLESREAERECRSQNFLMGGQRVHASKAPVMGEVEWLLSSFECVQIVRLGLQHFAALGVQLCAVVCPAVGVQDRVVKLKFNDGFVPSATLDQNRSRRCPESVCGLHVAVLVPDLCFSIDSKVQSTPVIEPFNTGLLGLDRAVTPDEVLCHFV